MLVARLANVAIQQRASTPRLYTSLKWLLLARLRNCNLPATSISSISNCRQRTLFCRQREGIANASFCLFAIARIYMYKYYKIFNNHFFTSTCASKKKKRGLLVTEPVWYLFRVLCTIVFRTFVLYCIRVADWSLAARCAMRAGGGTDGPFLLSFFLWHLK